MAGPRPTNGHNGGGHDEMPTSWMSGWFDPELEDLFAGQPELKRTATMLRAARPQADPDVHFRNRLRTALLVEATRAQARRRRWLIGPVHAAWAGTAVGVAAIAATVLTLINGPAADHQTLVALSNVAAHHSVSTDDVITVSFNQPMDHQAVVGGLHITPATQVQTAWRGNDLVITPLHHLTANTPYTVTIERQAARTSSGTLAHSTIQITFGTASAPPRTGTAPTPSLATATLGSARNDAAVLFGPDGSVVVTSAPAPPAAPEAPSTPGATPTAGAGASSSAASATGGPVMLEYAAGSGKPRVLGPAASLAAFSPNGGQLAYVVADSSGTASLVVARADGSRPATLAQESTAVTSFAWGSNRQLIYATADDAIRSIDLSGVAHTLAQPAGVGAVQLSPDGRHAYLSPQSGDGGELLDVQAGTRETVPGAGRSVAFSADGSTVAWVDSSQTPPRLQTEILGTGARVTVTALGASDTVDSIALSPNGSEISYVQRPSSGRARLVLAQLPSGALLAVGPAASSYAFSADGAAIALLNATTPAPSVQRALVPGATQPVQSAGLPAAARTALQAFIDAQVSGSRDQLTSLSTPSAQAQSATPGGLSRGYVVSAALNEDGSITATAELIVDPTSSHPSARTADETLTLSSGQDDAFLVTALAVSPLRDEQRGPHVVSVTTAAQPQGAVLQINFDSDLDRSTVAHAISVVAASGEVLQGTVTYNEETRSATVVLNRVPSSPVTVNVDASLRDVDGQSLANAFSTRAGF